MSQDAEAQVTQTMTAGWSGDEVAEREAAGQWIGPYHLLERIGEGGFGTVWKAVQEEPVRRQVALKILKPGMDSREVIARFSQERQALAMMEHPHIARVFDAGATASGRPYFVMELVSGSRITDYCDHRRLPTAARLELFIAVCQAVQHAHQKGIIHRDLKPSNILVTEHDGKPVPKVIDFGIAKAAGPLTPDSAVVTQAEQRIGTPLYMSPEQAAAGAVDVDTRSDVYSLGVVLYELLAGRLPFAPEQLLRLGADEMRRVLREEEPPRPSLAVGSLKDETRSTVALHRCTEPARLATQLRGDIDWIVMKALEKDRARRYDSAAAFAEDLRRHLEHEPVTAGPPSQLYRLRKLMRRHRAAFSAGAGIAVAVLAGLGVSLRMYFKEKSAREDATASRRTALRSAARSEQVASFLKEMLRGVSPEVAQGRDTRLLAGILTETVKRLDEGLSGQPDVEAELRDTVGSVFDDLEWYREAEQQHRKAADLLRAAGGGDPLSLSSYLHNQAVSLMRLGEYSEAGPLFKEAFRLAESAPGGEESSAAMASILSAMALMCANQGDAAAADAMFKEMLSEDPNGPGAAVVINNYASFLFDRRDYAGARPLLEKALELLRKEQPAEQLPLATAAHNLALVLRQLGQYSEAMPLAAEALEIRKRIHGAEHFQTGETLMMMGSILSDAGDLKAAVEHMQQGLAIRRKLLGRDHVDVAQALEELHRVQLGLGERGQAEAALREALAIRRKVMGESHPRVDVAIQSLAMLLWNSGKGDLAATEALFREVLQRVENRSGRDSAESLKIMKAVLLVQLDRKEFAEAERTARHMLGVQRKSLSPGDKELAATLHFLALSLDDRNPGEKEALLREALAVRRQHRDELSAEYKATLSRLQEVLRERSDFAGEELLLREELEWVEKSSGTGSAEAAGSLAKMVLVLLRQRKYGEGETLARRCLAVREALDPDDWKTGSMRSLLGSCLLGLGRAAEAVPLLLAGYEEMKRREASIPRAGRQRLVDAAQNLVDCFDAAGEPEKAAEWRRITELERAAAGQ